MMEFSKWLMVADYLILIVLIRFACVYPEMGVIAVAWIAQIGISTGFYYWKAKNENRIKIPIQILKSLHRSLREELDLNQIITTIIEKD